MLLCALLGLAITDDVRAAEFRIEADTSGAEARRGGIEIHLGLSARVPFRVFTLAAPDRLVVDLKGVAGGGPLPERFAADGLGEMRYGLFTPQWTRIVLELSKPHVLASAAYAGNVLGLRLDRASPEAFAAASRAPANADPQRPPPPPAQSGRLRVAVDAGHGGIDPGAVRDGVVEKDIVLKFAREFAALAAEDGRFEIVLIRDADVFVSLSDRVEKARAAEADLFVSVHADTVARGHASGATVYTLSKRASDETTAAFAARENASDAAAGLDTRSELDVVHGVLSEMAAIETNARSQDFAQRLVGHLRKSVGVLSTKPHRSGRFIVLTAHDMPSVLLELGFLTSAADRTNLTDPAWRRDAGHALLGAIAAWAEADDARRAKMFQ